MHPLEMPTLELLQRSVAQFDADNKIVEEAIRKLVEMYPENVDDGVVLWKVVIINALYRTAIVAPDVLARQLVKKDIDSLLERGDLGVIDLVADVEFGNKKRWCYSFATKYCNWHKPDAFPIFDSRVRNYLLALNRQERFSDFRAADLDAKSYPRFVAVVDDFRRHFGFTEISYKALDKFLYMQGASLL